MKKNQNGTLSLLRTFSNGAKRYFVIAVAAAAISIIFNFLLPQVVGFTVDSVIGTQETQLMIFKRIYEQLGGRDFLVRNFILCAGAVVVCAVVSGSADYLSRVNIAKGTERFTKSMRDKLFEHTQHLPFSWHTESLTGDIIQRCTSDLETARKFISKQLIEVVRTIILLSVALVIMFMMNVKLALLVLAFIPVILGYTMFFYRRISGKFLKADETEGELMVRVQENLTGVRVVRAFGREKHELDRFDEKNNLLTKRWIDLGYTLGIYWEIGEVTSAFQLLAVVVMGAFLAARGEITLGQYLVFISYTTSIGWPVRQMGNTLSEMSKTGVSFKRLKEILDAPVEQDAPEIKKPPMDRDIEFKHVSFSYGQQEVLHDVSFTVKSGTTFGILGATGSGKSTITYLLNRLYELDRDCGTITVGGVDLRDIDMHYLRKNIGLVLQEPFLFSKTIFENIDIAARSGNLEQVRRCAETAAVDNDIIDFPNGYYTMVGERGVTLSGGQKQRIAMARTLMTNAPVMVFDDSMSSLDMETDAKIREALAKNTGGATVILISHRISTLMKADKIMVLENGAVAELGSHDELMARNGLYRRTYEIQSAGEVSGNER